MYEYMCMYEYMYMYMYAAYIAKIKKYINFIKKYYIIIIIIYAEYSTQIIIVLYNNIPHKIQNTNRVVVF